VRAAENGERLSHGTVYVASPDRHLVIERGTLRLTRGPRENRVRPSVDALFRSAAVDLGPRVIGVVLSGVLDDGTAGLWAVKDRGGVAMVQEPDEAEYPDMPKSALEHVGVDHVLPAVEIGPKLAALATEATPAAAPVPPAMATEAAIERGDSTLGRRVLDLGALSPNACPECHGSLVEIREGSIVRYRCHTGHSFSFRTLLEETEVAIEKSLWNTIRAIEERSFLLRTLEQDSRARGNEALADQFAADAEHDEANARRVRLLASGAATPAAAD
jgi:two-component system chemotaxis response regulator CheB